jgi:hypothetical protein
MNVIDAVDVPVHVLGSICDLCVFCIHAGYSCALFIHIHARHAAAGGCSPVWRGMPDAGSDILRFPGVRCGAGCLMLMHDA